MSLPTWRASLRWAAEAGQSVLQILPIVEMPPIERSPYSSMTAMALDPIYLSLPDLPDFAALGGEAALDRSDQAALEAVRQSPRIQYAEVRRLKNRWLRRSWDRFVDVELQRGSARATEFDDFTRREAWWLDEYATFRALHAHFAEQRVAGVAGSAAERESRRARRARDPISRWRLPTTSTCNGLPRSNGQMPSAERGRRESSATCRS